MSRLKHAAAAAAAAAAMDKKKRRSLSRGLGGGAISRDGLRPRREPRPISVGGGGIGALPQPFSPPER
ncbi:unnamed protein product [Lampetra fluviatilis]